MSGKRMLFGHMAIAFTAVSLIYLSYVFVLPQILRLRFRSDLSRYDLGIHGFGPSQRYMSFEYQSPAVEISQSDSGCDPGLTFLAPRGDSIAHPGPMILDAEGNLVWMKHNLNITQDFKVQWYRGQNYLTYWEGEEIDGRGQGSWYMLDQTYIQRFEVRPVGDFDGDLHEFQITDEGTALVTIYHAIPADLTSIGGPASGWIYDSVFQEIDIATGDLVFEWHASHHYPINSTFERLHGRGKVSTSAFDFFHINSIQKDIQGNYLISARHVHTISSIDHNNGAVLWTLGGKHNEFTDISYGAATNFSWQHDARWHQDNNILTVFDNSANSNANLTAQSRAMVIELDVPTRRVVLRAAYYHPQEMKAVSQGNAQILESGNVFVGWGHSAAFTEFHPDGTPLCDVHFGASAFFTFGRAVSYRVFKGSWVGKPLDRPVAKVFSDNVFVSWNGATEVFWWRLEIQDPGEQTFHPIGQFKKYGFETRIPIPENATVSSSCFRLAALDSQGEALGFTDVVEKKQTSSNEGFPVLCYWIMTAVIILGIGTLLGRVPRRELTLPYRHS